MARIDAVAAAGQEDAELCGHWAPLMAEHDEPDDWPREHRLLQSQAEYDDTHPWVDGGEHAICLDTTTTTKEA